MPLYSVIVPAYNRPAVLRRALSSIAAQTLSDFECLVVDDASTDPIKHVVEEFDERFRYVRRESNGGCTAARLTGCEQAKGEFVAFLDSDNELLPWALERAAHYLHEYPDADSAVGLYIFPDGLRIRIQGGVRVVGPEEFAGRSSPAALADCVGIVRRRAIEEWLSADPDYFSLDFALVLRLHLAHAVVLVDEPWGRYDQTAAGRMSEHRDAREFEDIGRFLRDVRPLVGSTPCGPVDVVLVTMWVKLLRNHRFRDAEAVAAWLAERGISRRTALWRKVAWSFRRRVARARPALVEVL